MKKFNKLSDTSKNSLITSDSENILTDKKSNRTDQNCVGDLINDFYPDKNSLDSELIFGYKHKMKTSINCKTSDKLQSDITDKHQNQPDYKTNIAEILKNDDSNGKRYSAIGNGELLKNCKKIKRNKSADNLIESDNNLIDDKERTNKNKKSSKRSINSKFTIKQFEPKLLRTFTNNSLSQSLFHGTRNLTKSGHYSENQRLSDENSYCKSEEEAAIRLRLKWFEIGPIQKYKLVNNKPYKLIIQIFKIILVTTLVMVFALSLNRLILFKKNVSRLAENLFVIEDVKVTANTWGDDDSSINRAPYEKSYRIYQKGVLIDQIKQIYYKFSTIKDPVSLFEMNYTGNPLFNICMNVYNLDYQNSKLKISTYDDCYQFNNTSGIDEFLNNDILNNNVEFINSISIDFNILMKNTFEIITGKNVDYCFNSLYTFIFDNRKNNGEINFSIDSKNVDYLCESVENSFTFKDSYRSAIAGPLVLNLIVVGLVLISMGTCIRSLITHIALLRDTKALFLKEYNIKLNFWEKATFFDLWILLILFSDVLALLGTISKFIDDFLIAHTHDISSMFLGLSCLTVWFGLLRFLTFLPSYNGLLVVLRLSALTVLRVICCMLFIFIGFVICGYLALGPYHSKFKTIFETSECLFSLMNGDEIFTTFEMIEGESPIIVIFCNIYLAVFNVIFIYCVVSIFIATVCHYQEYKQVYINKYENNNRVIKFIRACDCKLCSLSEIRNIYNRHIDHGANPIPASETDLNSNTPHITTPLPSHFDPMHCIVKDIKNNDL